MFFFNFFIFVIFNLRANSSQEVFKNVYMNFYKNIRKGPRNTFRLFSTKFSQIFTPIFLSIPLEIFKKLKKILWNFSRNIFFFRNSPTFLWKFPSNFFRYFSKKHVKKSYIFSRIYPKSSQQFLRLLTIAFGISPIIFL